MAEAERGKGEWEEDDWILVALCWGIAEHFLRGDAEGGS